MSIANAEIK